MSDAFERADESHGFEWTATMLNINSGRNKEIMEKCKALSDYAFFIWQIRQNCKELELKEAVDRAVKECIDRDVLKEVLTKHRREVVDMCLTEFDEEKYGEILREEGREEGRILQLIDLVKDGIINVDFKEVGKTENRGVEIFGFDVQSEDYYKSYIENFYRKKIQETRNTNMDSVELIEGNLPIMQITSEHNDTLKKLRELYDVKIKDLETKFFSTLRMITAKRMDDMSTK